MRYFHRIAPIFVALVCLAPFARAGSIQIPAGSYAGGTWQAGLTVEVQGSISVTGDLVIQPGALVRVADGAIINFSSGSTVTCDATAASPAVFTSAGDFSDEIGWSGLYISEGSNVVLRHATIQQADHAIRINGASPLIEFCIIQDIAGHPGANGASPGAAGTLGAIIAAVEMYGDGSPIFRDNIIQRVSGGRGGDGASGAAGNGFSPGGAGGKGGDGSLGYGLYIQDMTVPNITFERNVIREISGGQGGNGGSGGAGSIGAAPDGGAGGGAGHGGSCSGITVYGGVSFRMVNGILYDIASGNPGTAGLGGAAGLGGTPGAPGAPGIHGAVSGLNITNAPGEVDHFTIVGLGGAGDTQANGIVAYYDSAQASALLVTNNTLSNLKGAVTRGLTCFSANAIASYNNNIYQAAENYFNMPAGVDDIFVDPLFSGAVDALFRPAVGSPLVNAGLATSTHDDIEGNPRGSVPDIGAYELPGDYDGRIYGDFDNSRCTDLSDFLFLLDNWLLDVNGTPIGIGDFLALLDYWLTGSTCP